MPNLSNDSQEEDGQLYSATQLLQLVQSQLIPIDDDNNVVHAFGYGSGVLQQRQKSDDDENGVHSKSKVVDVILVVKDALAFHRVNLQRNPHHYCSTHVTPERCTWIQRHQLPENPWLLNPGVYFHVTPHLKYGVVQVEDLLLDLREWKFLYLAGRMHKPVVTILDRPFSLNTGKYPNSATTEVCNTISSHQQSINLPCALSAGLLTSQCIETDPVALNSYQRTHGIMTDMELFTAIASLSYRGDPRMTMHAEDPDKIQRLVAPTVRHWRKLYRPSLDQMQKVGILNSCTTNNTISWDTSSSLAHDHLWQLLPQRIRCMCGYSSTTISGLSQYHDLAQRLSCVLATSVVAPSARYQSLKGLWTAGLSKSVVYALRKLRKGGVWLGRS